MTKINKSTIIVSEIIRKITKVVGKKNIYLHEPFFNGSEKKYLLKCIKSTFVSTVGKYVNIFEKKIKVYTKSPFVIATSSGTAALHISYLVSGIKKNDEVLIPTLNFIASSNAAVYCGAIPHFVDVENKTLGINVNKLENYLQKITIKKGGKYFNRKTKRRIKAIVPTHVFGHIGNIQGIINLAKKYKLVLIEDSAEAIGSFYKKKHAGTFGDMGVLSFNGNKTITTGSGGAILFKKRRDYKKAKLLINLAKKIKKNYEDDFETVGFNYKMSNLQAALGCAQIEKLKKIILSKHKLFKNYRKEFQDYNHAKIFEVDSERSSNYWLNTLILDNKIQSFRKLLLKKSNDKKIEIRPCWKLMHRLNHFIKNPKMNLSEAEKINLKIINIPSSPIYGIQKYK